MIAGVRRAPAPWAAPLPYADYLRAAGRHTVVSGLAYVLMAYPGVINDYPRAWTAVTGAPGLLVVAAAVTSARRRRPVVRPPGRPRAAGSPLSATRVRRTLRVETTVSVVGTLGSTVLVPSWSCWTFGIGWAMVAYGLVQMSASCRAVRAAERHHGVVFYLAHRPPLGLRPAVDPRPGAV